MSSSETNRTSVPFVLGARIEPLEHRTLLADFAPLHPFASLGVKYGIIDMAISPTGEIYVSVEDLQANFDGPKYIAKYSSDGSQQWFKTFDCNGELELRGLAVDSKGGLIVGGFTSDHGWAQGTSGLPGDGQYDGFLMKLDASGEQLWTTYLDEPGWDYVSDVAVNSADMIYAVGHSPGTSDRLPGLLWKFAPDGTRLWSTRHSDRLGTIDVDAEDNVYVGGVFFSGAVMKFARGGRQIWRTELAEDLGSVHRLAVSVSGDVYISGGPPFRAEFVSAIEATGAVRWVHTFAETEARLNDLVTDADGNLYAIGRVLMQFDRDGQNLWSCHFARAFTAGALDPSGTLVVAFSTDDAANLARVRSEAPPAAPTDLAAISEPGAVRLTWTNSEPVGHEVWRGETEDASAASLISSDVGDATYLDSTAIPQHPYYYFVRSRNEAGVGEFSEGLLARAGYPIAIRLLGTVEADTITLTVDGDNYVTSINGQVERYYRPAILTISIEASSGDDVVTLAEEVGPVTVYGGPGDDTIQTGGGDDSIIGSDGHDVIGSGPGNDTVWGDAGGDQISGGPGDDSLDSGLGRDTINGDAGEDTIRGGNGMDLLRGGDDNDSMVGGGKPDTLYGGPGDDTMWGNAGADLLYGEDGDDYVKSPPSSLFSDTLNGGAGTDRYWADDDDTLLQVETDSSWQWDWLAAVGRS